MYIHGAIAALVGDPGSPNLVCNFAKKKNGHDEELEYLQNKCFSDKLELHNPNALQATLKRFISNLYEVIELQAKEEKEKDKIIPVILGIDGRKDYPLTTLIPILFSAAKEFIQEKSIAIEDFFSKISIKMGSFGKSFQTQDGLRRELNDEENAALIIRQNSSGHILQANQFLESIKDRILKKDPDAIKQASQLAHDIGYSKGVQFKQTRSRDERFVLSYKYHPSIEHIPLLNFMSWHPDIKKAFRDGHAEGRESEMQVVVQTIDQVKNNPSPPFADILSCYIQDAFQGISNLEVPHNQNTIDFVTNLCKSFVTTASDMDVKGILSQAINSVKVY